MVAERPCLTFSTFDLYFIKQVSFSLPKAACATLSKEKVDLALSIRPIRLSV
jgi:hypothetical protein